MRKRIAFVVFTAISLSSFAQQKAPAGRKLDWGIRSGISISTLGVDNDNFDTKWRTGFHLGAFFRIKATNNLKIQLEPGYASMGGTIADPVEGDSKYRLNYFTFPVLANYQVNKHWRILAGPEFDFLITAKEVANERTTKVDGEFEDHSIGVTGGVEYWPCSAFGLSARYIHGLSNINPSGAEVKNRSILAGIAIKL